MLSTSQVVKAEALESASAFEILPKADIYVLGEIHDNPVHHANQATVIRAIKPKALVFEMLHPGQAANAQGVDRFNIEKLDSALGWSSTSWPDFRIYYKIFTAAPQAQLFGAAVERDTVRAAIKSGAAAQFPEDLATDYGLTEPLKTEEASRRETGQADAHCGALPAEMLPGMVEAQRLRDASFARKTLEALTLTGGPVVVITGNGHARKDWGIPRYLARANPEAKVLSIGQVTKDDGDPPFDHWFVTGVMVRDEDPCAAFGGSN